MSWAEHILPAKQSADSENQSMNAKTDYRARGQLHGINRAVDIWANLIGCQPRNLQRTGGSRLRWTDNILNFEKKWMTRVQPWGNLHPVRKEWRWRSLAANGDDNENCWKSSVQITYYHNPSMDYNSIKQEFMQGLSKELFVGLNKNALGLDVSDLLLK